MTCAIRPSPSWRRSFAADSRPTSPHPAGEGLRWIAHGFSALGLSDHEIVERESIVYDALYAECVCRVQA